MTSIRDWLMERTLTYRIWQTLFALQKFDPVLRHNDLSSTRRVLDVGCGPGTNTDRFRHAEYLGIDINPGYIESARARTGREFRVADVTTYRLEDQGFDFILANSFLHHIADDATHRILSHLNGLLAPDGHVHILDLVLPRRPSAARLLAKWDRGDHPRSVERWEDMFSSHFTPVVFEPYPLTVFGVRLWSMVYFKGAPK